MGANTYIGNAPNFMVKAIARSAASACRASSATSGGRSLLLFPLFVLLTFLFFLYLVAGARIQRGPGTCDAGPAAAGEVTTTFSVGHSAAFAPHQSSIGTRAHLIEARQSGALPSPENRI